MAKTANWKCDCGQDTDVVMMADGWHYAVERHGTAAKANGKCVNCRATVCIEPDPVVGDTEAAEIAQQVKKTEHDTQIKSVVESAEKIEADKKAEKKELKEQHEKLTGRKSAKKRS